jgi:Ni/Co efflux regulator RcnB
MEQLQETYEAGGFVFRTKKEAELAQREIEGTKYLRQKLDMENPNAVFSIYQNLIEQDLFETPVGYCFLKELRDYLLMIPAISNEEVLAIPIRYPQTEEEEKKQKKEQKKEEQRKERQREKEKAKNKKEQKKEGKNYKGRCQFFMVTSLILLISVVSMLLLAATSDNVNILNYENKLIDKYSSWEQELEEREQAVKEQEQALEEK